MMERKRYAAFLSYAHADLSLVEAVRKLLELVGLPVFVADDALKRAGTPQWEKELLEGIRNSSCFVPLLTPSALKRPWVLYESGAADAYGLRKIPARVMAVSRADLNQVPLGNVLTFDLFDEPQLCKLVLSVLEGYDPARKSNLETNLEKILIQSIEIKQVARLARVRWVFIAGSRPEGDVYRPAIEIEHASGRTGEATLRLITRDITLALLRAGFSVMSCPEVPDVGKIVQETVLEQIISGRGISRDRFRIAGLYAIDRMFGDDPPTKLKRGHIDAWLMDLRKGYLLANECLLVLGGNRGTEEEVNAARQLDLRICSIPNLLGYGQVLYDGVDDKNHFPVTAEDRIWNQEVCQRLVFFLQRTE